MPLQRLAVPFVLAFLLVNALAANRVNALTPGGKPDRQKRARPARIEVCRLLNGTDIQKVQGEPVEEARPIPQPGGGLKITECLFRTNSPAKSVSLALAEQATQQPGDFWRKRFHSGAGDAALSKGGDNKAGGEAGDPEASAPRAIPNVGKEAYWLGGRVAGALYVLEANSFFRISVGGVRDETERIRRSVALARLALKRLEPMIVPQTR